MKKILVILILGVIITLSSCASEKCECTVNGVKETFTEDDISNGSTIDEVCSDSDKLNKNAGTGSCQMV